MGQDMKTDLRWYILYLYSVAIGVFVFSGAWQVGPIATVQILPILWFRVQPRLLLQWVGKLRARRKITCAPRRFRTPPPALRLLEIFPIFLLLVGDRRRSAATRCSALRFCAPWRTRSENLEISTDIPAISLLALHLVSLRSWLITFRSEH